MLRLVLSTLLLFATAAGSQAGVWFEDRILDIDGEVRYYRFYVPEDLPPDQPLVILLHGGNSGFREVVSNGARALWPELADEEKFILAVPNGVDPVTGFGGTDSQFWNDCRTDATEGISSADDVAFIDELVDWFLTRPNLDVDPDRIYLTGLSTGGLMAYRLLAELPNHFAALGLGMANLPVQSSCSYPAEPISTILFMGDDDKTYMPWDGGCVSGRPNCEEGSVYSAEQTRDYFLYLNDLTLEPQLSTFYYDASEEDHSRLQRDRHLSSTTRFEMQFMRAVGGGHNLPTIENPVEEVALNALGLGNQNHDGEAAREIWTFFKRQRRGGIAPVGVDPGESRDLYMARDASGELELDWTIDCMDGSRYSVYRGDLSLGLSSVEPVPGACDLFGTSLSVTPLSGVDEFFLIVPNDGVVEGSYGRDSADFERNASPLSCYPGPMIAACAGDL